MALSVAQQPIRGQIKTITGFSGARICNSKTLLFVSFSTGQGNTRKPEWAQDANEEKPWNSNDGFDDGRWSPDKYDDGQWKPNGNQRPDQNGKYPQFVQTTIVFKIVLTQVI